MDGPHVLQPGNADGSTESPAETAERILRASSYRPLRQLKCKFSLGVLTVTGPLPSFYLKQLAQSLLANLEGVERLENRTEITA